MLLSMKTIQTIVFELQGKSFFAELLLFSKKCLLIFVHLSNTSRGYPRISNNHISEHKRPPGSRSMDSQNPKCFWGHLFWKANCFFHCMARHDRGLIWSFWSLEPAAAIGSMARKCGNRDDLFSLGKKHLQHLWAPKRVWRFKCTFLQLWLRFLLSHACEEITDQILLMSSFAKFVPPQNLDSLRWRPCLPSKHPTCASSDPVNTTQLNPWRYFSFKQWHLHLF